MKSGIYRIQNVLTGDFYIGSSSNCIHKRCQDHKSLLRHGKHHNIHLQRAWNKYSGYFVFGVVEYCCDVLVREQFYIDTLSPKYNIHRNARNSAGIKRRPESIEKMRASRIGKHSGSDHYTYGKKRDPETVRKISDTLKKKFAEGKYVSPMVLIGKHSSETLRKMVLASTGNTHRRDNPTYKNIEQYTLDGNYIMTHSTAPIAANSIGRCKRTESSKILRACKSFSLSAFGYRWKLSDAQVKSGELLEA